MTISQLTLKHVPPFEKLDLELGSRLNVLAGENGLGKTLSLEMLWWGLTSDWCGKPILPQPNTSGIPTIDLSSNHAGSPLNAHFVKGDFNWSIGTALHCEDPVVVYAAADGWYYLWDRYRSTGGYRSPSLSGSPNKSSQLRFHENDVWNGLRSADGHQVFCNGLILDWGLWETRRKDTFESFTKVLRKLSPEPSDPLTPKGFKRVAFDDPRDIPTVMSGGLEIPIIHLSSGTRRILALAYLLVWAWHERVLAAQLAQQDPGTDFIVMVDEVDVHLHPQWQRRIVPALLDVLRSVSPDALAQLFVATHSPLVLASLEPCFDQETDALFVYRRSDNAVVVENEPWRARGTVSAWLESDVFGLKQARSPEAERAIEDANSALSAPDIPIDQVRAIHHRLRAVLGDLDPYWARWVYFAERKGIDP